MTKQPPISRRRKIRSWAVNPPFLQGPDQSSSPVLYAVLTIEREMSDMQGISFGLSLSPSGLMSSVDRCSVHLPWCHATADTVASCKLQPCKMGPSRSSRGSPQNGERNKVSSSGGKQLVGGVESAGRSRLGLRTNVYYVLFPTFRFVICRFWVFPVSCLSWCSCLSNVLVMV